MTDGKVAARALVPWLDAADSLERWHASLDKPGGPAQTELRMALSTLRTLLQALADGAEAVPRQVPAQPSGAVSLPRWLQPQHAHGHQDIRHRRALVLRLGVWQALRRMQSRTVAVEGPAMPLSSWHVQLSQPSRPVPPGLGPALSYARSESAQRFFDTHLRRALARLAAHHDSSGAAYGQYAHQRPFEDTGVSVHAWSGAWTAAVAAVYLDWLDQRNRGHVARALHGLWCADQDQVRFRAPAELAVLPSRERSMHFDLWTDVVLAQVLDHVSQRWKAAAEGAQWHRVQVDMHDLGERTRGSRTRGEVRTVVRGLGIGLLYQTVFLDRVNLVLGMPAKAPSASVDVGQRPQTVTVDLPLPRPGQEVNFEFVIRWFDGDVKNATPRFARQPATPALTAGQRAVWWAWQIRRTPVPLPLHLAAVALDWHAASDRDRFDDEDCAELAPLGRVALWRAAGADAQWLEFALVARLHGRWLDVPVHQHEEAVSGEVMTWLLLPSRQHVLAGAWLRGLRVALATPDSACWVAQQAGVGAFVMAAVDLDAIASRAAS